MTLQQPSLAALAKQGDFNALTALMHRTLQPKGILVRVAHQKGCLRVLLEGQTLPDQKSLAPYIRKGIVALQIPGLHTLSVLGQAQGTSTPAWSETFALHAATGLSPKPQTNPEHVKSDRELKSDREQPIDSLIVDQESTVKVDQAVASAANPEAIATHLNQTLATEALVFEAALSDRILKLTAKTNQILEGDTFAKSVQTLLLPLNLSDVDVVHLYKQKTRGNSSYRIKEFTLLSESASTEAAVDATTPLDQTDRSTVQYQSTRPQPPSSQPTPNSQASKKSKVVMMALAALFVVLLIGAIKLLAKPPAATDVCRDAAGKSGYCQLAVQMMGEQTLHNLKDAAAPITPAMSEKGLSLCENATDLQTRRHPIQKSTRYSQSINSETIFPGIMVVDTQIKASPQAEVPLFRTACLLAGHDDQVELIKNVVVPNGWPQEPYQGKQEWEPMQRSLKAYQILIMLGGGTLFTAIGLFAASTFNLGFQIYTLRGLFQTASILGTLDTLLIVISGAKLNLFGGVPLTCLALGLTQMWVKDLRVDWAAGYRTVAFGVFLMMVIRFVLNWLLLGFIFSVL
jgi:hypothetical protein